MQFVFYGDRSDQGLFFFRTDGQEETDAVPPFHIQMKWQPADRYPRNIHLKIILEEARKLVINPLLPLNNNLQLPFTYLNYIFEC